MTAPTLAEVADVLRDLRRLHAGEPDAVARRHEIFVAKRALLARAQEAMDAAEAER